MPQKKGSRLSGVVLFQFYFPFVFFSSAFLPFVLFVMAPRPFSLSFVLFFCCTFSAIICPFLPFDKSQMCQFAQNWPLNGRPLVNDYRGRVLLLVFTQTDNEKKCEREMKRLDTLSEHFADVRVLAVAPRAVQANELRAFAWQMPRIRFERETTEAPVWHWFNATQLDKAIFDRCSRLVGWVSSGADFATVLSLLQITLSASPCGYCDFDSGKKRIHWPSFHPPVPQKKNVFVHIDGLPLGPSSLLRRWNSPSAQSELGQRQGETNAEKRRRMHWTVDNEQQQQRKTSTDSKQLKRKSANDYRPATAAPIGISTQHKQMPNYLASYPQQQKYLYGQQFGQMRQQRKQQTEERPDLAQQQQQRHGQQHKSDSSRGTTKVPTHGQGQRHFNEVTEQRNNDGTRDGTGHRSSSTDHSNQRERWQAVQQRTPPPQQQRPVVATTAAAGTEVDPAPLYPEGSEDNAGDDYYGDEYAAEWTTEAPEVARQIPKPTNAAPPTPPTTQTDKNFGFELPCTGFSDDSCFQQQTQLRPNEVHRCCRGRILFTDQCAVGKCSNATVQLCCIQRFLQAKLTCCSDERQADTEVGDHFSRCCFEQFVDGEDPCCPRAYAVEQWRSVHELCLPNVEMDLTGVKVPSPLVGTTLITEFDFSKTDRWRFECRYGSHVQQYSFFETSASAENDQQQRNEEEDE